MTKSLIVGAAILIMVGSSASYAQTTAQPAATTSMDKKAVSKACSAQADTKGLHGKERKKFRSECKKTGGK